MPREGDPNFGRRVVPVYNTETTTVPGFALMAIDSIQQTTEQSGLAIWRVRQPTSDDEEANDPARLMTNGPVPIPPQGYGTAYTDWPSQVLHDSTDTITFGEAIGCKASSWYAWADRAAFTYLGEDASLAANDQDGGGITTVWVGSAASGGIKQLARFTLGAALTTSDASKAGTLVQQFGPGSDNATAVTLYNLETHTGGTYVFEGDSGDAGLAMWDSGTDYRIIQMECP